jgi:hypothetical protein
MSALLPTETARFHRHLIGAFEAYSVTPHQVRDTALEPIVGEYGDPDAPVYALRSGRRVHTNTALCPGCDTPLAGCFCDRCDEWVMPLAIPAQVDRIHSIAKEV